MSAAEPAASGTPPRVAGSHHQHLTARLTRPAADHVHQLVPFAVESVGANGEASCLELPLNQLRRREVAGGAGSTIAPSREYGTGGGGGLVAVEDDIGGQALGQGPRATLEGKHHEDDREKRRHESRAVDAGLDHCAATYNG